MFWFRCRRRRRRRCCCCCRWHCCWCRCHHSRLRRRCRRRSRWRRCCRSRRRRCCRSRCCCCRRRRCVVAVGVVMPPITKRRPKSKGKRLFSLSRLKVLFSNRTRPRWRCSSCGSTLSPKTLRPRLPTTGWTMCFWCLVIKTKLLTLDLWCVNKIVSFSLYVW